MRQTLAIDHLPVTIHYPLSIIHGAAANRIVQAKLAPQIVTGYGLMANGTPGGCD
jgi:hypothetical protein